MHVLVLVFLQSNFSNLRRRLCRAAGALVQKAMAAWMASSLLRLEYAAELIPAGGCEICACLAAPVQQQGKEAAGHAFHAFARRQSGLDGVCCALAHGRLTLSSRTAYALAETNFIMTDLSTNCSCPLQLWTSY